MTSIYGLMIHSSELFYYWIVHINNNVINVLILPKNILLSIAAMPSLKRNIYVEDNDISERRLDYE